VGHTPGQNPKGWKGAEKGWIYFLGAPFSFASKEGGKGSREEAAFRFQGLSERGETNDCLFMERSHFV
jgi:hypothetical protein